MAKAQALALRVIADRLERGERAPELNNLFVAAGAIGRPRELRRVLAALLRIGWTVKRTTGSNRVLQRPGWPDVVFAFHDSEEIGPRMLARIARHTGLQPADL